MTTYQWSDTNSSHIVRNAQVIGTAGNGRAIIQSQSSQPASASSNITTFSNASNQLSWLTGSNAMAINTSAITTNRVFAVPDLSDTLLGVNTSAVLSNKTITGGVSGNTVNANVISGITISGAASNGTVLTATGASTASWIASSSGAFYSVQDVNASINSNPFTNIIGPYGYPGTAELTLTGCTFLITTTGTGGAVRIYDFTHSLAICTVSVGTVVTNSITDTGAISNLPATPSTWYVQAENLGGVGAITITGMTLKFG